MLSINECRTILMRANPDREWSDDDVDRLRGALYGVAELALDALLSDAPTNQIADTDALPQAA